jgi:NAD(P)H-hydrate epimerase
MFEWATPLLSSDQLREADRHAIEDLGIPGVGLIERAAIELCSLINEVAVDGPIAIVCGKGNNGADGMAAAKFLLEQGKTVFVYTTFSSGELAGDAAAVHQTLGDGVTVELPESMPAGLGCVVDCVLGTGAAGEPRGSALQAIRLINDAVGSCPIVACDVPSGVDASTGEVAGEAVVADLTLSFHALKIGLKINIGKRLAGAVRVADIGIPDNCTDPAAGLIEQSVCSTLPTRAAHGDKFSAGAVVVAGGSPGLTGAPVMAGLGAARGGAGYVTLALPDVFLSASERVPELMGLTLPSDAGCHTPVGADAVVGRSAIDSVVVLGPGLGRSPSAAAFAVAVASAAAGPIVIDADAIRAIGQFSAEVAARTGATVITPHEGELAALLNVSRAEVSARRLHFARTAAERFGALVVLKGDDTLICEAAGATLVSPGGSPALATAGSGDVLAGLIAALLARGVEPIRAAAAAVTIHLEAGRFAAAEFGEGTMATDIAGKLAVARAFLSASAGR